MARGRPVRRYALVFFGLGALLAVILLSVVPDGLVAWILALSAVTFLAFGYDKGVAGSGAERVPERVLLALAAAGGTLGAVAGMQVFHHKTVKATFRRRFWLVVLAQVAFLAAYWWWRRA